MGPTTRHPSVGKKTGPNSTDRGKLGAKRSLLVEGHGLPLGVAIDGANRNDMKLFVATILSMPIQRRKSAEGIVPKIALDAGYDYPAIFDQAERLGLIPLIVPNWYNRHLKKPKKRHHEPGPKTKRWLVERLHSWLNRYRRLLVRWDKKAENYLAMIHFAFAHILYKQAKRA